MATRLPFSSEQYWNACKRNAFKGAFMGTFEAGTTGGDANKKVTFTSADESVDHANPIQADANGIFPEIYGNGAFFIEIQNNALDEIIIQADNIQGSGSQSFTAFASLTGEDGALKAAGNAGDFVETFQYNPDTLVGGAKYEIVDADPGFPLVNPKKTDGSELWLKFIPGPIVDAGVAGIIGDGADDTLPKLLQLIDALPEESRSSTLTAINEIVFQVGDYNFSGELNLKKTVLLSGGAGSLAGGFAVSFFFPANSRGIIINRFNTFSDGLESPTTKGADGSTIEHIRIVGSGGTDLEGHGIWLRARAVIKDCLISDFSGNGLNIVASASGGASTQGNANNWSCTNLRIIDNNKNGVFIDGADVNSGYATGVDSSSNGRWGFYDSSFLGNTYTGCHTASNSELSRSSFGGNRYYCLDETLAGTTEPGTDPDVWLFSEVGGDDAKWPLWVNGGVFFEGGAVRTDNANARNFFVGQYTEGGQGPSRLVRPSVWIGGIVGPITEETEGFLMDGDEIVRGPEFQDERLPFRITTLDVSLNSFFTLRATDDNSNGQALGWNDATHNWQWKHANSNISQFWTGDETLTTAGRSEPMPRGIVGLPGGFILGEGAEERFHDSVANLAALLARGTVVAKGELYYFTDSSPGGRVGAYITTAGTLGTTAVVKEWGSIDA